MDSLRGFKGIIARYYRRRQSSFRNKIVIDLPAGNGTTSELIRHYGGTPLPFDLFPEYFTVPGLECKRCDINEGIPLGDQVADMLICQEGIEHFTDQFHAFREFNRVLKPGGTLLVTTPNYSNLRSKLSYLLSESERFNDYMPPNELDSIWMTGPRDDQEIYLGHIFLVGIQKLRVLGKLAGFRIRNVAFTEPKSTSILLMPLFYPFILLSNCYTYWKNMRKRTEFDQATKRAVYGEVFRLSINPKILIDGSLVVEYEKEMDFTEVKRTLTSKHKSFDVMT